MESQEGTFVKAAGIGAAVVFVSISSIALLMVLVTEAFSGTVAERLAYIADNSLVAALPWFIGCIWAGAEIPTALGLYSLVRKNNPGIAGLGVVFHLLSICVRFIAFAMLLGIVGAVAWAGVAAATFGLVDAVAVCVAGAGLLLFSVAMLLLGFPLTKEKGLLSSAAWLLIAGALSFLIAGFFKVLVLMRLGLPVAVDVAATVLIGPVAVLALIAAFGLLAYAIWSKQSGRASAS